MRVRIVITLKNGVHDPQGHAIRNALHSLGYDEVCDARQGKIIDLEIPAGSDASTLHDRVDEMCRKLLANTVIENYTIEIG